MTSKEYAYEDIKEVKHLLKNKAYKLKPDIHITSFLKAVDSCKGKVILKSGAGDELDLKSQLCKYLLLAAASEPDYLASCTVQCGADDAGLLGEYL